MKITFLIIVIFLLIFTGYLFIGKTKPAEKIVWGVNFSQKHSQNFGLDWKKNYLALLDDLKIKNIKLITHWNLIEPENDKFYFDDLDFQIKEAQKRGVKILLVIGMKTGRWPECHIPEWAKNLDKEEQQKEILELIKQIVLKYRDSTYKDSIWGWQVENEPFFPFGECPKIEKNFVKEEFKLVRSLDDRRPIVFTDSGEFSFWINAAKLGDIVGITLHRKVWYNLPKNFGFYLHYPFNPTYYWRKAQLIENFFNKEVILTELQAEPWCKTLLYDCPLLEQEKTMNPEQFKKNIEFAQKAGFDTIYLWGAEWWYWLKEKEKKPELWEEVKKLIVTYE